MNSSAPNLMHFAAIIPSGPWHRYTSAKAPLEIKPNTLYVLPFRVNYLGNADVSEDEQQPIFL